MPPPNAAESLDRQHITFQTVRPGDYPTPYELMLKQGVQFSAVDRKAGRLTTLMVRLCDIVLFWVVGCFCGRQTRLEGVGKPYCQGLCQGVGNRRWLRGVGIGLWAAIRPRSLPT